MAQFFEIHPKNPEMRRIKQVVKTIQDGGVIIYPTDSGYAIGCSLGNKQGLERIRQLRNLDDKHFFTLVCADLSQIATYAYVTNSDFRLLKSHTPGPYTFILEATKEVPKRLFHAKRKTIGIKVPDNAITQEILSELAEPIMSASIEILTDDLPVYDAMDLNEHYGNQVDLVVSGGNASLEPSTVVDLTEGSPKVLRVGKGDPEIFI